MAGHHKDLIGKTIKGVLVSQGPETPKNQLFLLFDDGTHIELFSEDKIRVASLTKGDMEFVKSRGARNGIFLAC